MVTKILNSKKGFTLVELLVVMSVIAILGTIAITSYVGMTLKATRAEAYAQLEGLRVLESTLLSETGQFAASAGICGKDQPGNVAAIRGVLPAFQPGSALEFSYCIEQNIDINSAAQTPCFRARAFGNSGSRTDGDVFMIDCNNNRNF